MQPATQLPDSSASASRASPSRSAAAALPQGDISATQSGPGAAGLFTPNSPGNAAAYNAQVHGGLEGSPIVDGNGSNLVVKVPYATRSGDAVYEQFTTGGVTGNLGQGKSSTRLPNDNKDYSFSTPAQRRSTRTSAIGASPTPPAMNRIPIMKQPLVRDARPRVSPNNTRTEKIGRLHATKQKAAASLRDGSGFIEYADGQTVLFGAGRTRR
jgi:hypothetical protein